MSAILLKIKTINDDNGGDIDDVHGGDDDGGDLSAQGTSCE